jgi:hypothetical protein
MKKIIIGVLIALFLGIILYYLNRYNKVEYFKSIELTDNNGIVNVTKQKYMDTVVSVGLDVLNIKDNYVTIREMPDEIKGRFNDQNSLDLTASIIGANDQYIIYIDNVDRITAIKSLSHELIHLQQYSSNRLSVIGSGVVIWNGKEINVLDIPYNDRPWEIEAFKGQYELEKKILEKLY